MTKINLFPLSQSWSDFPLTISQELSVLKVGSVIVEIGGGANPCLTEYQVQNFRYIVIDIDEAELNKAEGEYFEKVCTDIVVESFGIKCDILITNMLLEHIPNPQKFHIACLNMLKENGKVIHFFATKFSPASIVNIILPEHWSRRLLYAIQKRNWENEGKFPAYYRWCLGPTKRQLNRLESLGFRVATYNGYLGSGYLNHIPILNLIEKGYNNIIWKFKSPNLCSNAIIVALKN